MRNTAAVAMAACLVLAGCGGSFNPFGLFGGGQAAEATVRVAEVPEAQADPRPLVAEVARLSVDRVPGGVLVTAVGLPPTQGWFAADLAPERVGIDDRPLAEGGTLALRFVAAPPPAPRPVGASASREITAGLFLPAASLEGVRTITVRGARTSRSARP